MILVDTSVWVDHLRAGDAGLVGVLESNRACVHPFVIGELACGNLKARRQVLDLLGALPRVAVADDAEVLFFIDRHQLMGRRIGFVDVHLLAATAMQAGTRLWTRDKRLHGVAIELGVACLESAH